MWSVAERAAQIVDGRRGDAVTGEVELGEASKGAAGIEGGDVRRREADGRRRVEERA